MTREKVTVAMKANPAAIGNPSLPARSPAAQPPAEMAYRQRGRGSRSAAAERCRNKSATPANKINDITS